MEKVVKILIIVVIILVVLIIISRLFSTAKSAVGVKPQTKSDQKIALKLLPPQNIVTSNDNGTVTIKWREPQGAKSYILYYSNEANFTPETARTIGSITGSEFEISKVPAGKYYSYMTSISGARESEPSPLMEFDVSICTPPAPPQNFAFKVLAIAATGGKALLSWKAESTLDGYVIRVNHESPPIGDDSDHLVTRISDPMTANHVLDGLDPNVKWYVTISSVAAHCGEGPLSEALKLN
jgi:hypothetical protein